MLGFISFWMALASVFAIVVVAAIWSSVKLVKEQESMVIERLGKYRSTLSSGLNIVIPFMDRPLLIHWRY